VQFSPLDVEIPTRGAEVGVAQHGDSVLNDNARFVAFDSNALTYFLDGNRGEYAPVPGDPLWDQRVAGVRLFLDCKPVIVPTVRAEASRILNPTKLDEHMRFINASFGEFIPDDQQGNPSSVGLKNCHRTTPRD
jgi:hypothetical protein